MLRVTRVIAALALEGANVPAVAGHEIGAEALAPVLIQHAAASALLAWVVWDSLPLRARVSRMPVIALLFNFAFFVPILGLPGLIIGGLIAGFLRPAPARYPFASVATPEFIPARHGHGEQGVHLAVKSFPDTAQLPPSRRLKFLLALDKVPPRIAAPMLHQMLGDPSDDIRLLAYGFLDAKERGIAKDIERELARLEAAQGAEARRTFLRQLAELYWELAYSRMAQGDHRMRVLEQALQYTEEALALVPEDYEMSFLKGRILQAMSRDDEAYQALQEAIRKGLPELRALPYIAEIQFCWREYDQVCASLSQMPILHTAPVISGVIDFWREGHEGGHGSPMAQEHA